MLLLYLSADDLDPFKYLDYRERGLNTVKEGKLVWTVAEDCVTGECGRSYVHVHTHTHTHHTHTHTHTPHTHTHTHSTHTHTHSTHAHTHHTCMHTRTHSLHTHTHTHLTHACTHAHTHTTHMHAHTLTPHMHTHTYIEMLKVRNIPFSAAARLTLTRPTCPTHRAQSDGLPAVFPLQR